MTVQHTHTTVIGAKVMNQSAVENLGGIERYRYRLGWDKARVIYETHGQLSPFSIKLQQADMKGMEKEGFNAAVKQYKEHGAVPPCPVSRV